VTCATAAGARLVFVPAVDVSLSLSLLGRIERAASKSTTPGSGCSVRSTM
jgi:hypothetical protein